MSGVGFGLNPRGMKAKDKKPLATKNVFGGDNDDDDESHEGIDGDPTSLSSRALVNRQIAMEQSALRKRAQAALQDTVDSSIYDYDGAYDSFSKEVTATNPSEGEASKEDRKSRYVGDLLRASKNRNQQREAVMERKIAREQAEEDRQAEYVGKEKFVTKAYKRKLEERKRWQAEEDEQARKEDESDITKSGNSGTALASFYGNMHKNVAMGGHDEKSEKSNNALSPADDNIDDSTGSGLGFLGGFERSEDEPREKLTAESNHGGKDGADHVKEIKLSMREIREKKVKEALVRYLQRKKQ